LAFLLRDTGEPISGEVTSGAVCSLLSSSRLSPTVFFPCERNFIFFLPQFASAFVDDGEIESVPR
jgi:hypothetical protein